jgi:hypothetical protein
MITAPIRMTRAGPGERAEFLWLPWFTLGAVAWGALATGRSIGGRHGNYPC